MNCTETRSLLSLYLDGAVTGRQMSDISEHLNGCSLCSTHYALLKKTQNVVSQLGHRQVPPDLSLRIRVALSHEIARQKRPLFQGFVTRFENGFRTVMVPATAGVLSAIVFFALLLSFFAITPPVQARSTDVPTMLYTQPELRFSPFGWQASAIDAESLVVDVSVDANGRVQDYQIISAPSDSSEMMTQLNNMLIFTQFRPATSFGQPIPGRAVLSFSKINVKG